jgi:hypothetical protein
VERLHAAHSFHPAIRSFDRYRSVLELTAGRADGVGIAVPVLGGWHVYLASRGESSIESHDNHYLEGKAKAEGLVSTVIPPI